MIYFPSPLELGAPEAWCSVPCKPFEMRARTHPGGYGVRRRGGKLILAHREAWEQAYGEPIPPGLCICHHCDNPECVEIRHLFLGTKSENTLDRHAKGRSRGGSLKGSINPNAKLTEAQVIEIRNLGPLRRKQWPALEARYGVNVRHLFAIKAGTKWVVAA